jgi:uncharacterized DUF497 family protein
MKFEWDPEKAKVNEQKHKISFREAATVFGDPLAVTFEDPEYSSDENRFITFGQSLKRRLVVVSHTPRKNRIRIINARLMERKERKIYEEG